IWFGAQASRIRAAKIEKDISQTEILSKKTALKTKHKQLQTELDYLQKNLATYKTENKALIEELFKSANKSYESGLIDFFQFVQSIQNASQLQMKYLESLNQYNQLVLELNYLTY
ncbi:MAG: TolC family protein, partial [Bacteroidales bacterium]|nr:TolC family protein [Bacteroidales bacterium]